VRQATRRQGLAAALLNNVSSCLSAVCARAAFTEVLCTAVLQLWVCASMLLPCMQQ
jgi:hypothetical protein